MDFDEISECIGKPLCECMKYCDIDTKFYIRDANYGDVLTRLFDINELANTRITRIEFGISTEQELYVSNVYAE